MAVIVNTGFEFGTTTLITYGNAGNKLFDAVSGTPTISTTSPHNGTYCLECALTAATYYRWTTDTLGTSRTALVASFWVYFSGNPTALAGFLGIGTASSATAFELQYNPSTDQVTADCNVTSTSQVSTATFASGEWHNIELRLNVAANPWVLDWKIDGSPQPQFSPAAALSTIASVSFGSTAAYSGTCRYDDVAVSVTAADYPLGPTKSVLLRPQAAGTYTITGTTTNFNIFTANGTMGAWNAATARDNTRELPPDVSASSAGWAQVNIAASDYVTMPMEAYTLQANESVLGARMEIWGWAASTTAATIGFRSYNGTTETVLFAVADPNFANGTASSSGMVCADLTLADIDTQAELNALAIRGGWSSDATPDIGVNTVYVELCVRVPFPATASAGVADGAGTAYQPSVAVIVPPPPPLRTPPVVPVSDAANW